MVRSSGVKGGISRSTMLPWILEIRIEDEVLAKAFWVIAIMIRPGRQERHVGSPATLSTAWPRASTKTARNSSVVTIGARMVWVATLMKRRTSFM